MAQELPVPKSPLPKIKPIAAGGKMNPTELIVKDLHEEVVSLRQTLNSVLTYLKSRES
jgi:hypothetical protein